MKSNIYAAMFMAATMCCAYYVAHETKIQGQEQFISNQPSQRVKPKGPRKPPPKDFKSPIITGVAGVRG